MSVQVASIGDGAMATVCALLVAEKAASVRVWGRDAVRLADMDRARQNTRYLPGTPIPANIHFSGEPERVFASLGTGDLILCAVPTQYIRGEIQRLKPHIPPNVPVVSIAKGIENKTLKRPSEIITDILGTRPVAALSGPNIAAELARKLPATMVVACNGGMGTRNDANATGDSSGEFAIWLQDLFTTSYNRVYRNDDLIGVELAGALKNVVAIAAGILDGMRTGNNAKAALLTRGLVEISRLGVAMGGRAETFSGLAGLGDLVTTCVSPEGRNRSFGERVGKGEKVPDILASMVGVVEGMPTCASVVELAQKLNIEMPISEGLHDVLYNNRNPKEALADLMARELKSE